MFHCTLCLYSLNRYAGRGDATHSRQFASCISRMKLHTLIEQMS
jgi:hypothetical protein